MISNYRCKPITELKHSKFKTKSGHMLFHYEVQFLLKTKAKTKVNLFFFFLLNTTLKVWQHL